MPVIEMTDSYLEAFEALARTRAAEPAWLRGRRGDAFHRFRVLGFPTVRQEDWRFTNIAPIAQSPFRLPADGEPRVDPDRLAPYRFAEPGWTELVFVNGRYAPGLSGRSPGAAGEGPVVAGSVAGTPECPCVASLADLLAADGDLLHAHLGRLSGDGERAFAELNMALMRDGALVHVPAGADPGGAIHLLFYADSAGAPTMSHPRILVVMDAGARARIVESYVGEGTYFTNQVTEILLGPNASVDHFKLQLEAPSAFHVGSTHVRLGRDSRFASNVVMAGGRIARNDIEVVMAGEGADCVLNGVYLANADRLVDNHTTIDHAVPNCTSHELYKGILDDRARGVFNGKIFVRPGAQKTDAKQTNKVLLLSDAAQIDTKPQLEIFADDVKCTHGAAVGQLDEEALFYLRTRGIGEDAARNLLIYAFASDVVSRIQLGPLSDRLDVLLQAALPRWTDRGPATGEAQEP